MDEFWTPPVVTTRVCRKCRIEKPLEDFYKYTISHVRKPGSKGGRGRFWTCKDCCRAYSKEHRKAKWHHCKEYDRKRSATPQRKAAMLAATQRKRARDKP